MAAHATSPACLEAPSFDVKGGDSGFFTSGALQILKQLCLRPSQPWSSRWYRRTRGSGGRPGHMYRHRADAQHRDINW